MATSFFFYYLPVFYSILFFTKHIAPTGADYKGAPGNHNETHYAAVALGLALGVFFRGRLRR
jgi:hypothetical protein